MDADKTNDMPHYVTVAWTMASQAKASNQSPKRLSASKIVDAAAELASSQGLDAVTIRAVAAQVGFSTMAMYRHIKSRDELMFLLIERALGPAPHFSDKEWQQNVRAWATGLLQRYKINPWALDLPMVGMPVMPNHISWVEQALHILAPTGLSLQDRLNTALLIDGHVRQFARIAAASPRSTQPQQNDVSWLQNVAADVAPLLMLALQQGAMQSQKGPDFKAGLDIIVTGIQASIPPGSNI